MSEVSSFNQPLGPVVEHWRGAKMPSKTPAKGRYCLIEPLSLKKHAHQLFEALASDKQAPSFTYFSYGPFDNFEDFQASLSKKMAEPNSLFYAVIDTETQQPIGLCAYLRITPEHGTVEVGHVLFSTDLKKNTVATEAMYLMMQRAFEELGYRRYEWKCNALSQASREAALQLGFKFEGVFRQHLVFKNRSRDTAWFSIIDSEWPEVKERLSNLLAPSSARQVRPAVIEDIPEIISILEHNLLSHKKSLEAETLEKTGFLINGFDHEYAKTAILDRDTIFLVATEGDNYIGYTMGCDVRKLKSAFQEKLAAASSEMRDIIFSERAFYHKHIAKKSDKSGIGKKLLLALLDGAKSKGYKHIICQIAQKPFQNTVSIAFHEKHGFERVGYTLDGNRELGVYLKMI